MVSPLGRRKPLPPSPSEAVLRSEEQQSSSSSHSAGNLQLSIQQRQAHRRQRSLQKQQELEQQQQEEEEELLSPGPTPFSSPQKKPQLHQHQHQQQQYGIRDYKRQRGREGSFTSAGTARAASATPIRHGQQPEQPQKQQQPQQQPHQKSSHNGTGSSYSRYGRSQSNSRKNSYAADATVRGYNPRGARSASGGAGGGSGSGRSYEKGHKQEYAGAGGSEDITTTMSAGKASGKRSKPETTTQAFMLGYHRPGLVSQHTAPEATATLASAKTAAIEAATARPGHASAALPLTLTTSTSAPIPQSPPSATAQAAVTRLRAGSNAGNGGASRANLPPHILLPSTGAVVPAAPATGSGTRAAAASDSNDSLSANDKNSSANAATPATPVTNPPPSLPVFKHEGGRRYLRDPTLPYPLPVDLQELHRQSLRLVLLMRLFAAPFCNELFSDNAGTAAPPRAPARVLEVACGAALWSSACHDYFRRSGRGDVAFTGMDIAPLAPDLRATGGVNWRFVQHDMRRVPWPFADEEFDFIFVKDADFCDRNLQAKSSSKNEINRVLAVGGVVEVWSSDHVFRTLLPNPPSPPGMSEEDSEQADACSAYVISASTPFAVSQNKYLADYNAWVEQALSRRHLSPSPCGLTEWALRTQAETIEDVSSRRLALPFGVTRWEKEVGKKPLTSVQASLRRVALLTSLQFVESMEPVLRSESGKNQDEWDRWWAGLMKDLLEDNGALSGECLEVGAWWAVKT